MTEARHISSSDTDELKASYLYCRLCEARVQVNVLWERKTSFPCSVHGLIIDLSKPSDG